VGSVVWTSRRENLVPQPYSPSISYNGYHDYVFEILYDGSIWWTCATEISVAYGCMPQYHATGTSMGGNDNTAVFVENFNTDPNWYSGFDIAWYASQAKNVLGEDEFTYWSSEHWHTAQSCPGASYPPSNAISGTLTGYSSLAFYLPGVPLKCS
jgi:hypothetical protein